MIYIYIVLTMFKEGKDMIEIFKRQLKTFKKSSISDLKKNKWNIRTDKDNTKTKNTIESLIAYETFEKRTTELKYRSGENGQD